MTIYEYNSSGSLVPSVVLCPKKPLVITACEYVEHATNHEVQIQRVPEHQGQISAKSHT